MEDKEKNILPALNCFLFEGLEKKALSDIESSRKLLQFKKGESLFKEGDHPAGVYLIHEGYVKSFKVGSDKKEQIIYIGKANDLMGWQSVACDDAYSTSAVALERVVASFLPKEPYMNLIKDYDLSPKLNQCICSDIVMLESKILELSQKSVRERLASNIINLYEKFGVTCGSQIIIGVPLTREDYANIIGTNTETVIKLLSELRREGHIEFIERKLAVLNLNALRKFSDFYR